MPAGETMDALVTRQRNTLRRKPTTVARGPLTTSGLDLVARYYWAQAKRRTASVAASLSRLLVRTN
jgi:hypothetical protein